VRLLKAETVEMMAANRLTEAQRALPFMGMPFWMSQGFGLGLSVVLDAEKHAWMGAGSAGAYGWPGAFGTWWQADPAQDLITIYLIQDSMPLGPEAVANLAARRGLGGRAALPVFQKLVYAALGK
jgi:CubicO group peptidase (beta-lactamase class C family)